MSVDRTCDQCGGKEFHNDRSDPDVFYEGAVKRWITVDQPRWWRREPLDLCSWRCVAAYAAQAVENDDKREREDRERHETLVGVQATASAVESRMRALALRLDPPSLSVVPEEEATPT